MNRKTLGTRLCLLGGVIMFLHAWIAPVFGNIDSNGWSASIRVEDTVFYFGVLVVIAGALLLYQHFDGGGGGSSTREDPNSGE